MDIDFSDAKSSGVTIWEDNLSTEDEKIILKKVKEIRKESLEPDKGNE